MSGGILIIDPDDETRAQLALHLAGEGYVVREAPDAGAALESLRASTADLILLELVLPDLSGLDLCRIIRARSEAPMLMMSSRKAEVDAVLSLEVGADDYVTKPLRYREVLARVRALLRRSLPRAAGGERNETQGRGMVRVGRVWVDIRGHRVVRDGVVLPITRRCFQLLAFLLENTGQVFTREQLIERVWGYDFAGDTRSVNVHVSWLRSQIEDDAEGGAILQTVRGVGYVLRLPGGPPPATPDGYGFFDRRLPRERVAVSRVSSPDASVSSRS